MRVLDAGVGPAGDGVVVIRCGAEGCLAVSRTYPARWFPAFHGDAGRVVDATGAGNAFLGAFAVSLTMGEDLTQATAAGSVAASLAVEQIGLPCRSEDDEKWNGESFGRRVQLYRSLHVC